MPAESRMPTCPHCGTNDRVEATPPALAAGWLFYDPACNGVFKGTDEEFARMSDVRQKRRENARTAPPEREAS
jgi:hypothetical protein